MTGTVLRETPVQSIRHREASRPLNALKEEPMKSLDAATLDLTEMGSSTVPVSRAISAIQQILENGLEVRTVLIPYGRSSVIVYLSGPDAEEASGLL